MGFLENGEKNLSFHNYGKFNEPIGFSRRYSSMDLIA